MSDPKSLLLAAVAAYAKLKSYQDAGEVRSTDAKRATQMTTSFETRFAGPARFQFRFESPHPVAARSDVVMRNVIGTDSASSYHWSTNFDGTAAKIDDVENVDVAIARATGISYGAAHTCGQLLFKGAQDWLGRLVEWEALADAEVEGVPCHVIRGVRNAANRQADFYLDKKTLLLRKLVSEHEDFSSEEIRRDIRVDQEIPAGEFVRPVA